MHRLLTLGLLTLATTSFAQDWGQLATISSTMGIQGGKLCLGEASRGDIGCPAYAPSVSPTGTLTTTAISLTTSGTNWGYLASNASYLPNLNTNNISATTLNGIAISQLAGGTSSTMVPGWPDAIQCLNSPNLITLYLANSPDASGQYWYFYPQGNLYIIYNANQTYNSHSNAGSFDCVTSAKTIPQLYATGRAFNFLNSSGIAPTGAIMAFDLATCPTGWSEYTPARGRFLRGIDNGAGNDPSGTRALGNVQDDAFQGHHHLNKYSTTYSSYGTTGNSWQSNFANGYADATSSQAFITNPATDGTNGTPRTAAETRPKNVAVLFCRKD